MIEKNYRKTTGSLWNYYRDEPNNHPANNYNVDPKTNSALFKNKSNITDKTSDNDNVDNNTKNVETAIPLKHLINFWRTLDMLLVNCELSRFLTCSKNCVLTDMTTPAAFSVLGDHPAKPATNAPTGATFKISDAKLCVPVVTLSIQDGKKLLQELKTGFK